jgi:purine-nucleoside phosphorylase
MDYYGKVGTAAAFIRDKTPFVPEIAVVLGSGLGDFAGSVKGVSIAYTQIPSWPASTVVGHEGRLVVGHVGARKVAALSGRAHFYEGHEMKNVTFAARVMGVLGVKVLILTNAAGGINTEFGQGALMAIDDHINLMGTNPLVGPNDERFGPRFPDMTEAYSRRLRRVADEAARATGVSLAHGVYAGLHGPSYETPAEIRALRAMGADAVGMSTVPEVIVARQMGMEVLGISCITNMAAGVLDQPLVHSEVMETAQRVKGQFIALLEGIIARV